MNALLDYGSSSSSSESEEEVADKEKFPSEISKLKLPKPVLGESSLQTSVFSNPFVKAEQEKAAILEKHVKMNIRKELCRIAHTIVKYIGSYCKVPGKEETQMINGKKICWNHRKGRCRFGHKCKYAHDTDIQKTSDELEAEKQKLKSVVCEGAGTMTSAPPPQLQDPASPTEDPWEGNTEKKKLKRPGLTQGLMPSNKVIKMYKQQKLKDGKKL